MLEPNDEDIAVIFYSQWLRKDTHMDIGNHESISTNCCYDRGWEEKPRGLYGGERNIEKI